MTSAVALFVLSLVVLVLSQRRVSRGPRVEQRVSKDALQTCARVARRAIYPNDR